MNWSKEWKNEMLPLPYTEDEVEDLKLPLKQTETTTFHYVNEDAVQIGYGDNQVAVTLDDGDFIGTLVGDLVVYSNLGWKVAHYPTQTRFDDADRGAVPTTLKCVNGHDKCYSEPDPNCQYCEKVAPTKEQLLSWCDKVQIKHGSLWAILRSLTPDTAHDKSDRVMKAKDQIRDWCLSCEIE